MVFDEVHLYLTQWHFRPAFELLPKLRTLGVPLIYLSASVPPSSLPELQEATRVSWTMIREPSNRPEIKYNLVLVGKSKDQVEEAVQYLQHRLAGYGERDRALVFCRSKAVCTRVAGKLGVPAYYSTLPEDDRRRILADWVGGTSGRVLVNTPCLGTGFHYPSVRDVVHIEGAYTMVDQYQQDSRGGRDGRPSVATVFYSFPLPKSIGGREVDPHLSRWLSGGQSECARYQSSLYLDGVAVTCTSLPQAELCGFCEHQLFLPLAQGSGRPAASPVRHPTPPPNRKRTLELTPGSVALTDKRSKEDKLGSPLKLAEVAPSVPVTTVRSNIQHALNVAQANVPLALFQKEIDAPLHIIKSNFERYCLVCCLHPQSERLPAARHGTRQCPSQEFVAVKGEMVSERGLWFQQALVFDYKDACGTCLFPIRVSGIQPPSPFSDILLASRNTPR